MKGKIALMMITILALVTSISIAQDDTLIDSVADANVYAITDDGEYLWISTNFGLTKLNKNTEEVNYYQYKIPGLGNYNITSIALTENGQIWVGTDGGGAGLYDGSSWTIYTVEKGNLTNDTIYATICDTEGNVWFGTNYGLTMYDGENWTGYFTNNSDLPNNTITALTCDVTGIVWIGTEKGCVKYDGGNFTVYNKTNSELPDDMVNSIAFDSDGSLLIGTKSGLAVIQGETWTIYTTSNSGMTSNIVLKISVDSNNTMCLGVGGNKFNYSFDTFDGDSWSVFKTDNSELPSNHVQALLSDTQGNTWIGTDMGLILYKNTVWKIVNTGYTSSLGKWDVLENPPWQTIWMASCVDGSNIYYIGGYNGASDLYIFNKYDTISNTWTQKSNMLEATSCMSANNINGVIYVFGGWETPLLVQSYNIATDTWEQKTAMPTPRSWHGSEVVNNKIYVFGGGKGGTVSSSVEEYDPSNDSWVLKSNMPTPRAGFATCVLNDKIYIMGGFKSTYSVDEGIKTVEVYNPANDSWTTVSDMQTGRLFLSASVVNNKIYAIGGIGGLSTVEEYDPETDTWAYKLFMPTGRHSLNTAVVGGKIYARCGSESQMQKLMMGQGQGIVLNCFEVYTPFNDKSPTQVETLPCTLSLLQNYPNPFNPLTTISYQLDQPGMVNLVIYDLLGRKVATLVDEIKTPGSYMVNWNADGYPSGVYFYRLELGGSNISTQKMMLVK